LSWDALRKPPQADARSEQAGYGLTGPKARLIDIIRENLDKYVPHSRLQNHFAYPSQGHH